MKRLVSLALVLSLNACWFVYLPSSFWGGKTYCVGESAKVGSRVRMPDGTLGTVKALYGRSERCQDGLLPIRADLEFQET